MDQIKLTIVPTGKRDNYGDPIYAIEMDDNGHPGATEGSRIFLQATIVSNLKAVLARLDEIPEGRLTISFAFAGQGGEKSESTAH